MAVRAARKTPDSALLYGCWTIDVCGKAQLIAEKVRLRGFSPVLKRTSRSYLANFGATWQADRIAAIGFVGTSRRDCHSPVPFSSLNARHEYAPKSVSRSSRPQQPLELLYREPETRRHAPHVAQSRQADAVEVRQRAFAFSLPQPAGQSGDPGLEPIRSALECIFLAAIAEPLAQAGRLIRGEESQQSSPAISRASSQIVSTGRAMRSHSLTIRIRQPKPRSGR